MGKGIKVTGLYKQLICVPVDEIAYIEGHRIWTEVVMKEGTIMKVLESAEEILRQMEEVTGHDPSSGESATD